MFAGSKRNLDEDDEGERQGDEKFSLDELIETIEEMRKKREKYMQDFHEGLQMIVSDFVEIRNKLIETVKVILKELKDGNVQNNPRKKNPRGDDANLFLKLLSVVSGEKSNAVFNKITDKSFKQGLQAHVNYTKEVKKFVDNLKYDELALDEAEAYASILKQMSDILKDNTSERNSIESALLLNFQFNYESKIKEFIIKTEGGALKPEKEEGTFKRKPKELNLPNTLFSDQKLCLRCSKISF